MSLVEAFDNQQHSEIFFAIQRFQIPNPYLLREMDDSPFG